MNDVTKTSLSAGEILRSVLLLSEDLAELTKKIYPVATATADLPYITYRRTGMESQAVKGKPYNDTVAVEVCCYAATYGHSVELAERVRAALDGVSAQSDTLRMRSCALIDSEEDWEADAYVQRLVFEMRMEFSDSVRKH